MSSSDTLLSEIAAAVDRNFDNQVEWLKALVSFPSTRGNEGPCQDWLASQFAARDWAVDRFAIDEVEIEGKPGYSPVVDVDYSKAIQVVATYRSSVKKGKSLILQGHIDVVPTGAPEHWKHPPFEPRVADGFMSGRGANDMKVGVASMVFALDALRDIGLAPAADVFVETVSEEECTGNGALSTLERGYLADACLIPEAMDNRLVRAELGSVWFRLRILGQPVHVLQAQAGANAILFAYDYISALQRLTAEINEEAKSHEWFGHIENPVKFNPGKIKGGDWLGSVPSSCELECRLSVLPGHALADVRARVIAAIEGCSRELGIANIPAIAWIGFQAEGHVFYPGTEAEATLARVHETVIGKPLEVFSQTATSDTRQYDLYYNIPTLCYGSCGSGSHSAQEKTDLASMRETTKAIALFIAEWCGTRPLDGN
ncbi:MAG: ArgE/DapE family deacylase [Rhizobium sp.]